MAWNVKEKLVKFYNFMTAHPLSFARVVGCFTIGTAVVVASLAAQVIMGMISGWFLFLEIVLGFLWLIMKIINNGREQEIKRKSGYRW